MSKWQHGFITNEGATMLGQMISGGQLIITRAALGGGTVDPAVLIAQTDLTLPLSVTPIIAQEKLVAGKGIDIRIQIANTGVTSDLTMKQVGLYAKVDQGSEALLAIMQDDTGEEIPNEISYPDFMLEFTAAIAVSNTDNITVSVSGGAVVTRDDLDLALADYTKTADINTALAGKADLTVVNDLQTDISAHTSNSDIHVTLSDKAAWNGKAETSDIPTKLSELTNDSGFITSPDGGNADTVDGLHAADLMQIIDLGSTSTDTKTAVGIAGKVTAYWCSAWTDLPTALPDGQGTIIAINYKGSGTAGTDGIWARQFFYSASAAFSDPRIYTRFIKATNVSDWTDISDGGNAATVGGRSITVTDVDPGAGSALTAGALVFVTEVT